MTCSACVWRVTFWQGRIAYVRPRSEYACHVVGGGAQINSHWHCVPVTLQRSVHSERLHTHRARAESETRPPLSGSTRRGTDRARPIWSGVSRSGPARRGPDRGRSGSGLSGLERWVRSGSEGGGPDRRRSGPDGAVWSGRAVWIEAWRSGAGPVWIGPPPCPERSVGPDRGVPLWPHPLKTLTGSLAPGGAARRSARPGW